MKQNIIIIILITLVLLVNSCTGNKSIQGKAANNATDTIYLNYNGNGIELVVDFDKGKSHNHPTFAIWIEDLEGNYIQTLFATKSIVTGIFGYADGGNGTWKNVTGEAIRPAALPYWSHKSQLASYEVRPSDTENKLKKEQVDAFSGATPKSSFVLNTKTDAVKLQKFRVLMEINQTWDWNEFWTNNKYPGDLNYQSSSQPSLIYAVTIDINNKEDEYFLNPIGHGHYNGADGKLYTNLHSFTTALDIAESIHIKIK